jgi:hypothetical protein
VKNCRQLPEIEHSRQKAKATSLVGSGDLTMGMLAAALGATLVAMLLKSPPIYESLRARMLIQEKRNATVRVIPEAVLKG